jgi:predicted PurR-regulated permease PerM
MNEKFYTPLCIIFTLIVLIILFYLLNKNIVNYYNNINKNLDNYIENFISK